MSPHAIALVLCFETGGRLVSIDQSHLNYQSMDQSDVANPRHPLPIKHLIQQQQIGALSEVRDLLTGV